ncbi:MAG: hypothetical protein JXR26_01880 [Balneolaceae bacterium]|nr:hypothetical protein [Balneolaceae bacterium]
MEAQEFVLALAGIVFGTTLVGYIFGKFIGLIKSWINRNSSSLDEERFDRLAKAFIQHKKDSERRFQNLEAIVTGDKPNPPLSSSNRKTQDNKQHQSIEIESDHAEEDEKEPGNLQNMLNKKRTR